MRTKLISIGNFKGIRLPKAILEAALLVDEVRLRLEGGKLVITPARRWRRARAGWAQTIRDEIRQAGTPEVDAAWQGFPNSWDKKGWRW